MSEGQTKEEGKKQESIAKVTITWQKDLAFTVSFDIPTMPSLKADEPPTLSDIHKQTPGMYM